MSNDRYVSPLSERYASREMQYIFSPDKKFRTWRRLWIALAETEKELGLNITDEQIEELEEMLLLSEFRLKKEQSSVAEHVSELDGRFHRVLYEASDSRILEHVLTDFHKYVKLARKTSVGEEHRAEKSIQEHRAILEAIKQKDADKAEELANQHIKNVMQNLHLEE